MLHVLRLFKSNKTQPEAQGKNALSHTVTAVCLAVRRTGILQQDRPEHSLSLQPHLRLQHKLLGLFADNISNPY